MPENPLPEGIAEQTACALQNMQRTLRKLGMDLTDVLSVRVFLTQFERDYDLMNATYRDFFEEGRCPARTCIGVTGLVRNALIEVDCIAHRVPSEDGLV
jgi:enamine deaminase RidA (YjgF/YER057c/UK114 family)